MTSTRTCAHCGRTFLLSAHLANHARSHSLPPSTYRGMHDRVRSIRGVPSGQCIAPGCDRPATQWGWMHTGPSMIGVTGGRSVEFGTEPEDYAAMCRGHNGMLDGGGTWTHCPHGHDRASVGVYSNGTCRACRR